MTRRAAFEQARNRRERGIVSSILHAENDADNWPDRAFGHLCMFAGLQTTPWTIEQFREYAAEHGLDMPEELRAFGGVTLRALHRKIIERVGYSPAHSSNGSPKPLYLRRNLTHD